MFQSRRGNPADICNVLLALLGMSPAVLTETVWALSHENPPVIPDRIFVLTTRPGREILVQRLFEDDGWSRLIGALKRERLQIEGKLQFGCAGDHIRLLPKPDGSGDLEDIITKEDSRHSADFMMRCVREFAEEPGTRLISSIAGGRKTMSAILTSCMTLLGRRQDRLCHVLVNPPYDSHNLRPQFLFPIPRQNHSLPGCGKVFPSSKARIELTDIPYVRAREWYERAHGHAPPSYMSLVRMVQGLSPEEGDYPSIAIDMYKGRFWIEESEVRLSSAEFAFFSILARRLAEHRSFKSWPELEADVLELRARRNELSQPAWLHDFCEKKFDLKEDARKLASSIRKKVAPLIGDRDLLEALVPSLRSGNRAVYPATKIRFHN
jgi:CRISPR-associated protein (TIGR02584 family)